MNKHSHLLALLTTDLILRIEHADNEPIDVIQITDAHLGQAPGTRLLGIDTDESLDCVLAQLKARHKPSVLLCTGDLSNDGSSEAYQRFKSKVGQLNTPNVWLPGNHDERALMAGILGEDASELSKTIEIGNWLIIMLDSSVLGQVGGDVSDREMAYLKQQLDQVAQSPNRDNRHVIVCLHHHVISVNCAWLDQQLVANADDFLALLSQYPQLKLVLSGHVHQDFHAKHNHFSFISTPSTCIQFAPNSDEFKLDTLNPGYRVFKLYPDGRFETQVERLEDFELTLDTVATGY